MVRPNNLLIFQGFRGDSVNTQVLKKDADGLCLLSHAALCLFEEARDNQDVNYNTIGPIKSQCTCLGPN